MSAFLDAVDAPAGTGHDGSQYLTLLLAGEQYAIDILQVQEIRGWDRATRIPNAPRHLKGVINLRGAIVPVLDLRLHFGLPPRPYDKETVVVIVRPGAGANAGRSLGIIVDAVSDVLTVRADAVVDTPDFGPGVPTASIIGLAGDQDGMVMLLDVGSLMAVAAEDPAA